MSQRMFAGEAQEFSRGGIDSREGACVSGLSECLKKAYREAWPLRRDGNVADYIPELAKSSMERMALSVLDLREGFHSVGDDETLFTLQSISKVVALALALETVGEEHVFSMVGATSTADPFNSIMRLEMDTLHRPLNPMINAGAIVVDSLLPFVKPKEAQAAVLDLARRMAGNPAVQVSEEVYLSEKGHSDRNRSLAFFLRSVGRLCGDVEDVLDVYFGQCSILVCSKDLAAMGATLANGGCNPLTGEAVLSPETCDVVRAVMATCGMYDASGDFAVQVGFPAKSGVGGGILGAVKERMGIGTYGPALDSRGNSVVGMRMLQNLSLHLGLRSF